MTRGEQTRERILEAAEVCFARNGYDGTGVAEICQRAGVTKGGFYHHFPSKQALFLELLERWLETLDEQLAGLRAEAGSVPETLSMMAGMAGRILEEGRGRLPMFLEFWSQAARDPAIWRRTIAPYRRYRAFFTGLIESGIAEGTLRPVDPEAVAGVLVSLAVGVMMQGLMDPQGADWGKVVEEGVRLILSALEDEKRRDAENAEISP
ncbi:MAG TPA: TetR/AcrR family transcriptional regulator [Chloroflexi bacterium]|nr:TetR/AcrR family transcriptional regulator [Chloroflexota bacterium]